LKQDVSGGVPPEARWTARASAPVRKPVST
jgi:hypothetical protein